MKNKNMMKRTFFLIACLLSAHASAIDLNNDDPLLYALESISASDNVNFDGFEVGGASDELDWIFDLGFSLTNRSKFIRIDLSNGAFYSALPSDGLTASADYDSVVVAGGSIFDDFVIIEVRATSTLTVDYNFTIELDRLFVNSSDNDVIVTYRLYDRVISALNESNEILREDFTLMQFSTGFGSEFANHFTQVADIKNEFLRFEKTFRSPQTFDVGDATENLASLAQFIPTRLIVNDVRHAETSALITDFRDVLTDVFTGLPGVEITGDFTVSQAFLSDMDDCTDETYPLLDEDVDGSILLSLDQLDATPNFCFSATSNVVRLPSSQYVIDLGLGLGDQAFGQIVYGAAYFDLPYLTENPGLEQRITIVNHANLDMTYVIDFTSDASMQGLYTLLDNESGVIAANSSITLDTGELFELDEGAPTGINARVYLSGNARDAAAVIKTVDLSEGGIQVPLTEHLTIKASADF